MADMAGANTYTAMRSLPLRTPTQRYDRCHCMHLHTDTIAANAHARTAIRSLFLNTPAQRCNRFLHEHTDLHSDTIAAAINSLLKHDCKCMQASVVRTFFNYTTVIRSRRSWQDQLHHVLGSTYDFAITFLLVLALALAKFMISISQAVATTIQPLHCIRSPF